MPRPDCALPGYTQVCRRSKPIAADPLSRWRQQADESVGERRRDDYGAGDSDGLQADGVL
jgi:hypothetical protein